VSKVGQRLTKVAQAGNLRTADLARWFEVPYATLRQWVKEGRAPTGGPKDLQDLELRLVYLERLIRNGTLPIGRMTTGDRIARMHQLRSTMINTGFRP
jgi:hypothetical protein